VNLLSQRRRPFPRLELAAWGLAVLALHLTLLGPLRQDLAARARPPLRHLQVRKVVAPAPAIEREAAARQESTTTATTTASATASPSPGATRVAGAADMPTFAPRRLRSGTGLPTGDAARHTPLPPEPREPPAAEVPAPVYATRLPPSMRLRYDLHRAAATGQAELVWQTEPGRYAMVWRSQIVGGTTVGGASRGAWQDHGIEPERYTEGRSGRDQRAVNFQRETGLLTFSSSQRMVTLAPGSQDRLSWMMQLAGVLAADATLGMPGRWIAMPVASARGDVDLWRFEVAGFEATKTVDGAIVTLLHLRREPLRPYDTQVDVWVDPARHHLPVRVRMRAAPDGAVTDLELRELDPIP
jgi:hypothetical protein